MAKNIVTDLSALFMLSGDSLGSAMLNKRFEQLEINDIVINESFVNAIGIWQCSWYYDSSIRGYSFGDMIWLNTEEPQSFVKKHSKLIKQYTDLNSEILNKLPDFDPTNDNVVNQYYSAMSGYQLAGLNGNVVLPPIFDIGDYSKPIQLAISLKNNNKDLTTNEKSWKKLFVDSSEDGQKIKRIIDLDTNDALSEHLQNYHLVDREKEVRAQLSNYLAEPTTKQQYDSLNQTWYSKYNESSVKPSYGFDYSTFYVRKPLLLSGNVSQYQAVRYWKSGMIEHFGTIATTNSLFRSSDGLYFNIPFNWKIIGDGSGATMYESGELAKNLTTILSAQETSSNIIPPRDNFINVYFEKKSVSVDGLTTARPFKNGNYNISIHPIFQTQNGIESNYIPINYGEVEFAQKWNSNYLTNEIIRKKNRLQAVLRLNTRVLAPYISYYAVGQGDF